MRILGFICALLVVLSGFREMFPPVVSVVVPVVAQESMDRSVLRDVGAHDLARGVDAVGHGFECAWKLELLRTRGVSAEMRA